jgi:hypothetical protein
MTPGYPANTHRVLGIGLVAMTLVLSGCDTLTQVDGRGGGQDAQLSADLDQAGQHTHRSQAIVSLAVDVEGDVVVGSNLELVVRTTAEVGPASARLRVVLPDLEALRLVGPESDRLPVGIPLPAAGEWEVQLPGRGATQVERIPVVIPHPGYYRVAVSAEQLASTSLEHGPQFSGNAYREIWVFVDESGGRVTEEMDLSILPDSVLPRPGPRRLRVSFDRSSSPGADMVPEQFGPSRIQMSASSPDPRAVYYDADSTYFYPVRDAAVYGDSYLSGVPMGSHGTITDSDGYFSVPCNPSWDWEYEGVIDLSHTNFKIVNGTTPVEYPGCAWLGDYQVGSGRGKVWHNMLSILGTTEQAFNQSRSFLDVVVSTSSGCTGYFHSGSTDWVQICSDHFWGEDGRFNTAHEVGHAFHNGALGGIQGSCSGPHYILAAHSLECALLEGFANFFAIAVEGDSIPDLDSAYEWNWAVSDAHDWKETLYPDLDEGEWCDDLQFPCPSGPWTTDGARAELAVATFLHAVAAEYGAAFVGDVLEVCQVRVSGTWYQAHGIDHLIYCLERRVEDYPADGYFPTRGVQPNDWSASISLPGGWDADVIEGLGKPRLYPIPPDPPGPPDPPSGFGVWHANSYCPDIRVQLTWTNHGAGTKRLERRDDSVGTWTLVASGISAIHTSWWDDDAPADEFIEYRIRYEPDGDWTYSDEPVFTTCV